MRTDGGHRDPTFGQIAWQAFTALAHGAKGILYFVGWPDPDPKIFGYGDALFVRDVPPSVKGRTAASIPVGDIHPGHHMADAAKVNAIVLAFAQYLLKASSTAVYHLPSAHAADGGSHSAALKGSFLLDDLTGGCDCAGSPGGQGCERLMAAFEHCGHYLVGEFKLADGRPALMIQNQDPSGAQWPTVALHTGLSYRMVLEVDPEHGTLAPVLDSSALLPGLQLRIAPGMARLFVIDRSAAAAGVKTDDFHAGYDVSTHRKDFERRNQVVTSLKTDDRHSHLELFIDGREVQTASMYDADKGGELGTINRPFGTLAAAVTAVRDLPQRQRCGLKVTIAGGVYGGADNLFRLTEADNGCVGQPIVYRADPNANESVVLHGGAEIPPTSFKPNGSTASGLKVWTAELTELGLGALAATSGSFLPGWFPGPAPARSCANGNRTELFFGGHAMTLSRHPNKKSGGATPDQGIWQYLRVSAHGLMTPTLFGIGTDDTDGKKPSADAPFFHDLGKQAFAHGFWSFDWADSFAPVKSVTANSSGAFVELATAPAFGPPKVGARFVLMNSKNFLDAEGEYYISAADGTLYFIPPAGMDPSVHQSGTGQGAFLSEQTAAHKFIGVKHVTLQSLKLDYAMGSAISAVNVTGLSVINCSLSNSGTHGVELSGTNSSIESSVISDIGCDAVVVTGGDPVLLHDANLLVHNNSIHAFARVHRTVRPGVAWSGCGITVSANEIFDAPHSGIVIIGAPSTGASDGVSVNCVFEDNYLHDLCKGTADAGGFYAGKSWANRGNVIRRNRFQDFASVEILAMHTTVEKAGTGVNGIYLDDMESGWLIESNTFTRAGELCVMIGGGRQVRGPLSNHDPFPTPTCTIHFKKLSSWAKFGVL